MGDARPRFQELRDRGLLDFGDGYRAKNAELEGDGPIFLRAAYLQDIGFTLNNPDRFKETSMDTFGPKVAQIGDVVITTKGNSTGRIGVIRESEAGSVYSPHLSYWRSLSPKVLDQRYLYFWSRSADFQDQLRSLAYATDMAPYLSLRDQATLTIPLPPIEQQQAAASILGALEDKIEINRRMNGTLEAMARAIFRDWFVDFGPTRARMEGREPYLVPDLWAQFPDRLDEEGKPEGWEEAPLSAFFSILGGGTPKTSVSGYWGGNLPWFSVVDTPPPGNVFVVKTEKTITIEGLEASSARLVPTGTTIISARGTVGNLAMAAQEMAFNQSCYALRGTEGIGDYFVYFSAKNMVDRLRAMSHGSVFSTITRRTFDSITLPMPSSDALNRFNDIAEPLFLRIKQNVLEADTLAATRDLLLPKLMSGEIRVEEAEEHADQALQGSAPQLEAGTSP